MTRVQLAASTRALFAGAVCLSILGGMIVGHAWPLWTGQDVMIEARVEGTRAWTPGEYISLSSAADVLMTQPPGDKGDEVKGTRVRVIDPWPAPRRSNGGSGVDRHLRGKTVYVQLAQAPSGTYEPVSVSLRPVDGATNLRGVVQWARLSGELHLQYGIDAFYLQEGRGAEIEEASRQHRRVQMQVAIAASGRARIRNLLVDGIPVR